MTTHAHDPSAHSGSPPASVTADAPTIGTRPRWLMPALAVGIVAVGLVATGVVSLSTVLYAAMFGGMILMHLGGHGGHGSNGGHGGRTGRAGHAGPDNPGGQGAGAPRDEDLSPSSVGSQPGRSRSASELDERASDDADGNETHDHDQRNPTSCH